MKSIGRSGWLGLAGFAALALAVSTYGCGGDDTATNPPTPTPDAGTDAGNDATTTPDTGTDAKTPDAVADTGTDAKTPEGGTDTGTDAKPPEAGAETGADAKPPEAGTEAGTEGGTEAGTDGGDATAAEAGGDAEPGDAGVADADAATTDANCTGATSVALSVNNYRSWCSVSVAGGTATTVGSQTVCVAPGMVTLVASPIVPTFELGPAPWHDTVGDLDGGGDPGTMAGSGATATSTTTVNVSGSTGCAWVCCPFSNDSGEPEGAGCAVPTQCP